LDEHLISADFFLHIIIKHAPNDTPPYAQICRYLQKKLAELDYDQVLQDALGRENMGLERFPSINWIHDAWTIEFITIPKKNEARGKVGVRPIGSMFYDFTWVDSAPNIKASIDSKYKHYGELSIPYILALNIVDVFADEEDLLNALLGQEVWTVSIDNVNDVSSSRKPNGAWFGPKGPQKTRMSGVCVFNHLRLENMHIANPVLWHHPFAQNPLDPKLIRLTQQVLNPAKGCYELREGIHPSILLHLDENQMPK
jgi:hypothetical protein